MNTASVAGLLPEANDGAYVAAKHGVIGLTKTAAIEKAHLGIRVNALAPGWVRTALTEGLEANVGLNEKMKEAAPMHLGAEPEDMVGIVLYPALTRPRTSRVRPLSWTAARWSADSSRWRTRSTHRPRNCQKRHRDQGSCPWSFRRSHRPAGTPACTS